MNAALIEAGLSAEYPFEDRFLELPAGRMHYLDEGPRDAPPLLFVHGNPTWSFAWRRLVRAFRGELRCVAADHIGCGLSDKPQDWSYRLADHVGNLERLVLALDLRDLTLVMHDWGGAIGMGVARLHPGRIARLVLLNTAAFPGPAPLRIRACRAPIVGRFLVRRLNAFSGLAPRMAVARALGAPARAGMLLPYRSYADRVGIDAFVRDIPLAPGHPSWAELERIDRSLAQFRDRPACIVWGERDFCFTPAFRAQWQTRLPAAEVHPIANAGHWVFEDAPEELERILRAFLARHPIRAARPAASVPAP
jgi:pimeloyl-ACP methyl ester carboxylesterase